VATITIMTQLSTLFGYLDEVERHEQTRQEHSTINVAEDVADGPLTTGDTVFDSEEFGFGVIVGIDEDEQLATLRSSSPSIYSQRGTASLDTLERVPTDRVPTYSTPTGSTREVYR